jgi:hypothetical protein
LTARLAALVAVAVACAGDPAPAPTGACPGGCASGLRCYLPTSECVLSGVARCTPSCRSFEQCSARAATPTCYAQVCSLPARPPTPLLKVVGLTVLPSSAACDLDGNGTGDARLSDLLGSYQDLQASIDGAIASDRVTVFLRRAMPRIEVLFGTLAMESRACDPSSPTAGCRYTITRESYDRGAPSGPCPPWLALPDAALSGASLRAGGAGTRLGIAAPIGDGLLLLQLLGVRADGELRSEAGVDRGLTLRLCGAAPQAEILDGIAGLPADVLAPLGGARSARNLAALALRPDVDSDRDGTAESVSFALRLVAVPAETTGWSPPAR